MNAALALVFSLAVSAAEAAPGRPHRAGVRSLPRSTAADAPLPPAGREGDEPEFRPGEFVRRLAEAVDATPEQVAQLEAIAAETRTALESARSERHEAFEAHRDEVRELHSQIREARRAGDRERVRDLVEQIQALIGEPPRELIRDALERIKAVLTEEQQTEAAGFFRDFRGRDRDGVPGLVAGGMAKQAPSGAGAAMPDANPADVPADDNASPSRGRPGRHGARHFPLRTPHFDGPNIYDLIRRIARQTQATDEQVAQLTAIARDHVHAVADAEAQRIIAHEERGEALRGLHEQVRAAEEAGDEAQVESLRAQLREILGPSPHDLFQAARERIETVLTEEQRTNLPLLFPED